MIPFEQVKWIDPRAELYTALGQMDHDGVNQLPVLSDGQVVGILSRGDLVTFLTTLREFG